MSLVSQAIEHIGLAPIASRYGLVVSAVHKWKSQGRLPQSELAGLTDYARGIEELSEGKFKATDLRAESLAAWERHLLKAQRGRRMSA